MANTTELPAEIGLMRIIAQGLVPATASDSPTEAVRQMLATQGQMTSNVPHSLVVRTHSCGGSEVTAAFESGGLVRSWPFRGTLHITTAQDYRWLRALRANNAWFRRAAADIGLSDSHVAHARDVALEAVSCAPQTRAELRELWTARGVGAHLTDEQARRLIYILFVQFHQDGTFVSGPLRGNEHLIISTDLLPADESGWERRLEDGDPLARRQANAEVARRYALSHGPVTSADLARWTGFGVRETRQALADAVAASELPDSKATVVEAHLEGKHLTKGAAPNSKAPTFYLRGDLWDLLTEHRREASRTMYLAMFDELHAGYKDRTCLADAAGEKLICPGGNGMFRPLVVDRGRMVAVNAKNQGLIWQRPPSNRLEQETQRAIKEVESRLSR